MFGDFFGEHLNWWTDPTAGVKHQKKNGQVKAVLKGPGQDVFFCSAAMFRSHENEKYPGQVLNMNHTHHFFGVVFYFCMNVSW